MGSVSIVKSSDLTSVLTILDVKFWKALDDDLNIAGALAALFGFIGKINAPLTSGIVNKKEALKILTALENINSVLGIMDFDVKIVHREIEELINKRNDARKARNWAKADSCRDQLAELGVDLLDTPQGVIWRFK